MKKRIEEYLARLEELERELASPEIYEDQKRYRELTQEHSFLSEVRNYHEKLNAVRRDLEEIRNQLKGEKDDSLMALFQEEIAHLEKKEEVLKAEFNALLVPPRPDDSRNIIVELRAGTGGDEAAIFVGDCIRMYHLYADNMGWKYETLSCTPSERGGFKEYIMVMSGHNIKRFLQFEGGTHRVQRVPETEAQGRIHTSAITVAILPEPGEEEAVKIEEKDLRVETFRSSGAGGQHVNVTDSAVRLIHIPTGIVVACQEERSQHKNKDKALRLLKAKIADQRRLKKNQEEAEQRALQVGSGDRSERIRTYNFPQNRVTDHRINLTLYNLDRVMDGEVQALSQALVSHYYQEE
jgi:peptide chain release factor 1